MFSIHFFYGTSDLLLSRPYAHTDVGGRATQDAKAEWRDPVSMNANIIRKLQDSSASVGMTNSINQRFLKYPLPFGLQLDDIKVYYWTVMIFTIRRDG